MNQPLLDERRAVKRFGGVTIAPLELSVASLGLSVPASVRDISVVGIGLVTANHLSEGTPLTIKRRDARNSSMPPLTAEVRQATQLPDGNWLLGCDFSHLLSVDDILELG